MAFSSCYIACIHPEVGAFDGSLLCDKKKFRFFFIFVSAGGSVCRINSRAYLQDICSSNMLMDFFGKKGKG